MFVLYVVIASVPYASLGEGRYVGPNPSLHIMQWRTHILVVPYLESCKSSPVSTAHRGRAGPARRALGGSEPPAVL